MSVGFHPPGLDATRGTSRRADTWSILVALVIVRCCCVGFDSDIIHVGAILRHLGTEVCHDSAPSLTNLGRQGNLAKESIFARVD